MTLDDEATAAIFAGQAVDRLKAGGDGRSLTWRLFNGVVIRCEPFPQSYIQALDEAMPRPQPPIVHIAGQAGKADRDEENPDDPSYQQALREWNAIYHEARAKLVMAMGLSLDECPDHVCRPEADEWIETIRRAEKFTHKPIDLGDLADPDMRFIAWLRYYATDNETDLGILLSLPQWISGLRNDEVANALEAFRSLTERGTDSTGQAAQSGQNGNPNNRAGRRRSARV